MSELYQLIREVQSGNDSSLIKFILQVEPKINQLLNHANYNDREDLRQELFLKVILTAKKYKLDEVPDFEEFHRRIM